MNRDDEQGVQLCRDLGEVARLQEAERWWQAVERGDRDNLPEAAPPAPPLDPQAREALVRRVLAVVADEPPRANEGAQVISLVSWRRAAAGLAAAAAAVAALVLFDPRPPAERPGALPRYALVVRSGEKQVRGAEPSTAEGNVRYAPGSQLDLVVRPDAPVNPEAEIYFSAKFVGADGGEVPFAATVKRKNDALRLQGTFGEDIALAAGPWRLVILVSDRALDAHTAQAEGVQTLEHRFVYE